MAERVAGLDAGFLHTETATTLWHVTGVLVLDPSTAPEPFSVDAVQRLVLARLATLEAFRKKLVTGPFGLLPHWVDSGIAARAHVHAADLGPGAGLPELAAFAARVAEQPLDRSRPLWELHVVEHLAGGEAAVVAKLHHSLADGITAVNVVAGLLDLEAAAPGPAAVELGGLEPHRPPSLLELPALVTKAGAAAVGAAARSARHLADVGWEHSLPFRAPRTGGHQPLTRNRSVGLASLAVDDVRRVQQASDVRFNDVVLAAVAGAARAWLHEAGQLPDDALLAVVPASTRASDAEARSRNRVSALFVSLPVQLPDPLERLASVATDSARSKRLHDEAGHETLGALGAVAPWRVLGALWRASWWAGAARALPPVANLLVTSVPGPPVPLYFAGARLVGLYPLGPILEGVPLNITAVSREDRVEVGLLACPDLVPDVTRLAAELPVALAELVSATGT